MMNEQAKKILRKVWCEDAPNNRIDPEEIPIAINIGWSSEYEQNKYPERLIWNELLFRVQSVFKAKITQGILRWDAGVDYPEYSFTSHNGKLYVCNGAVARGGEPPDSNDDWREY